MGKGSNTTSTSSSTSADPQAQQAYRDLLTRAQGVASTPYQAYSGDLTADVNSQQNAGIAGINNAAGFANPYIQNASQQATTASAPIDAATLQQYQNPYTQQVIDATTQQLQHDNSQQMAQLQGNQISQGALGGNATGVAKGILAGQQGRTMASTTAGLYQDSYNKAMSAAQQQQQTGLAGANAQANYGISGQSAALQGAGAQIGAGTLQQQTDQANLNALYGQYQQQQAYPYQQTQWLAGLATGVGPGLGSTSTGTTTGPAPNQTAQYLGLGLSAASLLSDRTAKDHISSIGKMNDGTPIYRFKYKGDDQWHVGPMAQDVEKRNPHAVERGLGGLRYVNLEAATDDSVRERASGGGVGGMPWAGAQGWIPELGLKSAAPQHTSGPSLPQQPAQDFSKVASGITGLGGMPNYLGQYFNPEAYGNSMGGGSGVYGGSSSSPLAGLDPSDYGEGFARGGAVDDPFALDATRGAMPNPQAPFSGDFTGGDPAWSDPALSVGMGDGPSFNDRFSDAFPTRGVEPVKYTQTASAAGDEPVRLLGSTFGPNDPGPGPGSQLSGSKVVASDDDDEAAAGVAGRASGAGRPPVMAYSGEQPPVPRGRAAAGAEDERSGFGLLPISKNAGAGLLTAGLGMLASRSPFLGNAVGEGGLAGVAAYGAATERDRKIEAEADKLAREAEATNYERWMGNRKQTETEAHNVATEDYNKRNLDRSKWTPAGQFMGEDGIYRPVIMNSATGEFRDSSGNILGKDAKIEPKGSGKDGGFTEADADAIAERYVKSGDRTILQGLGQSGAAKIKVNRSIKKLMDQNNISPEEMAQRTVEFEGRKSGSRTLGTMEAKMGAAAMEAEGAIKLVRGVIEKLPRSSFLPLNKLVEGYSKNTLNPDQAELYARAQAIVNTYSAVMSRGANVTTDSSRHHAAELLNTAVDPTTFNRVLDTMQQEIDMAKASPARMQEYYRQHYGPKSVEGSATPPAAGAPPAAAGFKPPPGALPGKPDAKGKVWYYDPTTKQPYSGQ